MAADNKRHASGGKGLGMTPNLGPTGMVSLETALGGSIGARIRITTAPPTSTTLEGTLFTACPITNLVAINTSTSPQARSQVETQALAHPSDFHIIPVARIQSFQLLSLPAQPAGSPDLNGSAPFAEALPSIYPLDMKALRCREAEAISRLQKAEKRMGKGVTKEAQDLFDAFDRVYPTCWDGTSIVVAEAVVISKPYRPEDCRSLIAEEGGKSSASRTSESLARIRKILEAERKKMESRNTETQPDEPIPNTTRSSGTPTISNKERDRDLRAAAVAVPRSNARSSPQSNTQAGAQRKGG